MRASRRSEDLARLSRHLSRSPRLLSALLASTLILATFPDVFFAGTSLRLTDQLWGSYENLDLHRAHPLDPFVLINRSSSATKSDWTLSYNDIGGAVWQSEPMMEFMRHSLWTLDSPYWNPYSAAGSLGPETLVDLKFSILTIAYALLGGGTFVYNVLLLAFFWMGTYFVIRIVREKFELSAIACAAAGIFYVLNGYAAENVGSNVALSYLFIPTCLFASFSFADERTPRRFAFLAFAFAALLSFTFLPTTLASMAAIAGCTAGYVLARYWGDPGIARAALTTMGGQAVAIAAAIAVLAIIYVPFAESLRATGLLDLYAQRTFYPAFWTGALSLFTPSHFFNSNWLNLDAQAAQLSGNAIYHFGILGLVMAACAWRARPSRWHPLVWTCAAVIAVVLGRIFGVPGISQLADLVPVVRNLGAQYLWVAVAVPMTLLVAFGADNLRNGTAARIPATIVLVAAVAAGVTLALTYGLREPNIREKTIAMATAAVLGLIAAAAVWIAPRAGTVRRSAISGGLVLSGAVAILLFFELAADAKWLRFEANDSFAHPTSEVPFLQTHVGGYRTMTLGAYATTMDRGGAYQLQEVTSLNAGTLPGFQTYFNNMTRALPQKYRMGDFASLAYPQDAPNLDYYDWAAVDLLGVKYIIVPKTSVQYLAAFEASHFARVHDSQFTVVFENRDVMPRAFAVDLGGSPETAQLSLPTDVRQRITSATITQYRNTHVVITGIVDVARLVVLTDNWNANWRASVNGTSAAVVQVNGTFRGVWVPPGEFEIEMSYAPATLPIAIVASLLTALALTITVLFPSRGPVKR